MSSTELTKILSRNLTKRRDIDDIRSRVSGRLQELRRSKRSAVLNQFRQVPEIPEVKKKKTAAEEKLERLKFYKIEKQRRMDELKKIQKPPFYSIVKARHTGGTPYRQINGAKSKLPANLLLPANTRSKAPAQNQLSDVTNIGPRFLMTHNNKEQKIMPTARQTRTQTALKSKKDGPASTETKPETKLKPATSTVPSLSGNTRSRVQGQKQQQTNVTGLSTRSRTTASKNNDQKPDTLKQTKNDDSTKKPTTNSKSKQVTGKPVNQTLSGNTRSRVQHQKPVLKKSTKGNGNKENKIPSDMEDKSKIMQSKPITQKQNLKPKRVTKTTRQNHAQKISKEDSNPTANPEMIIKSTNDVGDEQMTESSEIADDADKGTMFQRRRVQNESDRLTNEADTWTTKRENDIPEHIKDEILAVVGQTKLLISKKFESFKSLIDRCESNQDDQALKVTVEDLDGFWEMMYQQVVQLDKRYRNLQELEGNNWQEKSEFVPKKSTRKVAAKKKSEKHVNSKFKEFLKSKQQIPVDNGSGDNRPTTPCEPKPQDITESSLYLSVREAEDDFEICNPDILKTPKTTPAIQRVLNKSRRRSSIALITLKQTHLMKFESPSKRTEECHNID